MTWKEDLSSTIEIYIYIYDMRSGLVTWYVYVLNYVPFFFGVLVRSVMSLIVYALPLHMAIQTIC